MEKFEKLSGIAAPMPLVNIDTDMIIPKVFLKSIARTGFGKNLFDEMRYDDEGREIPDFVLNQPAYRDAQILVAGETAAASELLTKLVFVLHAFLQDGDVGQVQLTDALAQKGCTFASRFNKKHRTIGPDGS